MMKFAQMPMVRRLSRIEIGGAPGVGAPVTVHKYRIPGH